MPRLRDLSLGIAALSLAACKGVEGKLDEVLEAAMREQIVFLNCTAGEPGRHQLVRNNWEDMVGESVKAMEAAKIKPEYVQRFRDRAAYAKLMRPEAASGKLGDLCKGGWEEQLSQFKMIILNQRVAAILRSQ